MIVLQLRGRGHLKMFDHDEWRATSASFFKLKPCNSDYADSISVSAQPEYSLLVQQLIHAKSKIEKGREGESR